MIPTIKFSHRYYKMPRIMAGTRILTITSVNIKDIPEDFKDYDTAYGILQGSTTFYKLPEKGKVIVLFLFSPKERGGVWTTIRRHTPEKEKYYASLIGQEVNIEITE